MSQVPFQLLELSVISAQDLAPVSKNLRTYGVAWVNPERKLRTRIDQQGQINPTWNDKFVFRVDDRFLTSDTSAVMIEIYALGWLRDIPVGSVRVLISNLIPPSFRKQNNSSRRFVALQIRRPSGRPQGILNMGVSLLNNTMKSMPLYTELSASAVGYRELMDGRPYKQPHEEDGEEDKKEDKKKNKGDAVQLWRSRSDRTDLNTAGFQKKEHHTYNRPSSVCEGSVRNGSAVNGSVISGSENLIPGRGNGSICSDVGPSPSIVAAAVAKGLYPTQLPVPHKPGSSILGDWTAEETSVEGLKSKIDRWRMELPPMYDGRGYQKIRTSQNSSRRQARRHSDGGGGLFSCFGNMYGCEFTIVCGANNGSAKNIKRGGSSSKLNFNSSELDSYLGK
ncbi:hypothetical protein RJ639_021081 [Escallonia herrerae]|uniref:C2 domain-containing protein n=1 Tax=Escallonia herrerae TaxID=1293975 RepID=A0AA88V5A3_9ASTE|nr:hypothetical protein RJ639_021081 [Escallonia herrerae]